MSCGFGRVCGVAFALPKLDSSDAAFVYRWTINAYYFVLEYINVKLVNPSNPRGLFRLD